MSDSEANISILTSWSCIWINSQCRHCLICMYI